MIGQPFSAIIVGGKRRTIIRIKVCGDIYYYGGDGIMVGYDETIEIIENIVERYNTMIPDIFKKLNSYEKELQTERSRHVFCKQDCLYVMEQNKIPLFDKKRLDVVCEAFLLLYNWYKSKIIYHIEEETINQNISIDKEKLKLFPYSGIYLDLEFYSLGYEGCFVSITKEKKEYSLRRYIMIGFVEKNEKTDYYGIEPFMLEIQDGISVKDAFMNWYVDNPFPYEYVERNIIASMLVISNLYSIIDTINRKNENIQQPKIKRKVTARTLVQNEKQEYRITNEAKYKYLSSSNKGDGSKKAPHVRRTHERHYMIKDENVSNSFSGPPYNLAICDNSA